MNTDGLEGIKSQLRKRLFLRQLQAAKYGISVDPVVPIECEVLERSIRSIDAFLSNPPQRTAAEVEESLRSAGIDVDLLKFER